MAARGVVSPTLEVTVGRQVVSQSFLEVTEWPPEELCAFLDFTGSPPKGL